MNAERYNFDNKAVFVDPRTGMLGAGGLLTEPGQPDRPEPLDMNTATANDIFEYQQQLDAFNNANANIANVKSLNSKTLGEAGKINQAALGAPGAAGAKNKETLDKYFNIAKDRRYNEFQNWFNERNAEEANNPRNPYRGKSINDLSPQELINLRDDWRDLKMQGAIDKQSGPVGPKGPAGMPGELTDKDIRDELSKRAMPVVGSDGKLRYVDFDDYDEMQKKKGLPTVAEMREAKAKTGQTAFPNQFSDKGVRQTWDGQQHPDNVFEQYSDKKQEIRELEAAIARAKEIEGQAAPAAPAAPATRRQPFEHSRSKPSVAQTAMDNMAENELRDGGFASVPQVPLDMYPPEVPQDMYPPEVPQDMYPPEDEEDEIPAVPDYMYGDGFFDPNAYHVDDAGNFYSIYR